MKCTSTASNSSRKALQADAAQHARTHALRERRTPSTSSIDHAAPHAGGRVEASVPSPPQSPPRPASALAAAATEGARTPAASPFPATSVQGSTTVLLPLAPAPAPAPAPAAAVTSAPAASFTPTACPGCGLMAAGTWRFCADCGTKNPN